MKKFCLILVLIFTTLMLFADDDDKLKLAVMEFEDLSGKLSPQMLSGATEYMRGAFVSSNKYVVIAKERQEKAMIKEMKKESYKSCNDKNCQIPLGQALSADTILRTTINFFGGVFTITSELIDLAKEATVSGAKQNFDGSERSLMQALDRIVVQIAGTSVTYNVEAMKTQEIQGVTIGGVELSNMPKIEMKEANFEEVKSTVSVGELEQNVGISLDADEDVLVLYDKCVETDKKAQYYPDSAIRCWNELKELKENNPFIQQAEKRISDWEKYIKSKKLAELFEKAKVADKSGQIFYEEAISAWSELTKVTLDNPYLQTANERYSFWQQYKSQINKYKEQLKKFEEQHEKDQRKLGKVLPLKIINDAQKRTILVQYMEIYAPFYGVEDVNNVINSFNADLAKELNALVFNDYLKKEMIEKCGQGNGSACYISATLTEVENPAKAAEFFEKSCEKGIVNACVKTGKIAYDKNQKKEAAKYFYESCGMESPEGCHIAAFVTEKGAGIEQNTEIANKIYQKACNFGYETSCKQIKQVTPAVRRGISADNVRESIMPEEREETHGTAAGNTYHPYKAAGISLIVVGAVVAAGGVAAFHILSDKEYSKYKDMAEHSTALEAVNDNLSYDEYLHKADGYRSKSNTYRILEITSGAVGGALLLTGVVLTAIKKEKPDETVSLSNISVVPSNDGFYAAVGFEF